MPTAAEILAELNGENSSSSGRSSTDVLAELNGEQQNYQPQFTPPAQPQRSGLTFRVGDEQVAAEDTLFADMPMPLRSAIAGAATVGAAIENPILRLFGRGDVADQNRRALEKLRAVNREMNKNSVLGSTVGPVVGDVMDGLTAGTLAAPLGGPMSATATKAANATRALIPVSAAFGIDGADRVYVEAKDAGLPENEAGLAAARQFVVDGALTFAGGKLVQSAGFNPGRYFGPVVGRAAQKAAERSGLSHILGSALADAGVNGVQGGLGYLNEAYTGLREFDAVEFATAAGMSAAVGGVAGAATSGVQNLQAAWERFSADVPKAVAGAKAANNFAATATPEQIQSALAATSAKEFAEATGDKGGPVHREAFQDELAELVELQAELDRRGVTAKKSLDEESKALQARRERVEQDALEFEGVPKEAEAARTPARQAEIEQIRERVTAERQAIAEDEAALVELRKSTEGELAEHRAILEAELDRLAIEQREAGETHADIAELLPPERQRTPPKFAERYAELDSALQSVGEVSRILDTKAMPDAAMRKDLGLLIQKYGAGDDTKVNVISRLANAKTPGQMKGVLTSIAKGLHKAETRIAKADYEEAVKRARNLRSEFGEKVQEAKNRVDPKSTDSLRDAAEAIREATYQSAMADTFQATQFAQGIAEKSAQIVGEIDQVRPLAMKSADPLRKLAGEDLTGKETQRQYVSLDSPIIREWGQRPEVQLERLSPSLREVVYEPIAVEGNRNHLAYRNEAIEGLGGVFDSLGLSHENTLDATVKNIATKGGGTALNAWRNEKRQIDGVNLSRGEALGLVLLGMDDSNAKVMEGGGFDFKDGRRYAKITDRVANQLLDFIGPEGQQIVEWQFQYLNGPNIDRVNDAKKVLTGRPLTRHKNRVPRQVAETWDVTGADPLAAIQDSVLSSYRHLKHREDAQGALSWPKGSDGITYFMNHVDRMARYAAYAVPARDAQAVLNNPDVSGAIKKADGETGLKNIQDAMRAQVLGYKQPEGVISPVIARMNAGFAAAKVGGGRLSTLFLQPFGALIPAAYRKDGLRNLVAALPDALGSKELNAEMQAVLGEHSPVFKDRFQTGNYMSHQTGGLYQGRDWFRPPRVADHVGRPIQAAELATSAAMNYAGAKAEVAAQGIDPSSPEYGPAVAREWERGIYRGENTSNGMEANAIIRAGRENPVVGMFALFQSAASKVFSLLPRALDKMDKGQYQDAIGVLGVLGTSVALEALLREGLRLSERDEPFLDAVQSRALQGLAGTHPAGQYTLEVLARAAQDLPTYESVPSSLNPVVDFNKAVGEFAHMLMEGGKDARDPRAYAEKLWSLIVPLAESQGVPISTLEDYRARLKAGTLFPAGKPNSKTRSSWDETVDMLTEAN